ncbi:MAG TPA: phosphatase [bacterium]|nr:phosphatase [bacterium]HPN44032.1 phosphatase [bacterium]
MIEIYKNLFIGNSDDYENQVKGQPGWSIVHACKEPYHRDLLGYTGRGAPKDHPEYLLALRSNRLYLNLIDVDKPEFISEKIIDAALEFIDSALKADNKCLVHCNQGESRSTSIGLLYLASKSFIPNSSLIEAENAFIKLYPMYNPAYGMRRYMELNWHKYTR